MTKEKDMAIIKSHVNQLMEHFDSVHIFATRDHKKGVTMNIQEGLGNWYARYGQVREWLLCEEESSKRRFCSDE